MAPLADRILACYFSSRGWTNRASHLPLCFTMTTTLSLGSRKPAPLFVSSLRQLHFNFPSRDLTFMAFIALSIQLLLLVQRAANFLKFFVSDGPCRARLLRKLNVDILHLNNSVVRNHDWMLGALISRTTVITHERGINERYSRMARFFAKRLAAIICISDAVRKSLAKGGIEGQNIVTIYNGIDPDVMTAQNSSDFIRQKYGIRTGMSSRRNCREHKGMEGSGNHNPSLALDTETIP